MARTDGLAAPLLPIRRFFAVLFENSMILHSFAPFLRRFSAALMLSFLVVGMLHPVRAEPSGPFAWEETTSVADAGWARMIPLGGSDWLCVDNLYPKPHAIWQLEISHDRAQTWTPISMVAEPGRDLDNGDLVRLPNGTLLLTGRSVILSQIPGAHQSYHLPVYQSTDGGKSWTFSSQVDTNETTHMSGQPSLGLWEPYLFLTAEGMVACVYSSEKRAADPVPYSQIISERISRDGGHTWGPELILTAQIGGGDLRPGMPVVTRMQNGQYMAVYEVIGLGDGDVYQKISRDGVHWPLGLGVRIPGQHHGPWVTTLSDGRLVVTSCANTISVSDDSGATWRWNTPPAVPFPQDAFSWPALYQTAPHQLAVLTSYHGVQIRWGAIALPQTWSAAFVSDFTQGDAGWTLYGGSSAVADGEYLLQNAGTTGRSLTGSPCWSDGVLEGDVMLTSAGNAGLVFRTTNAGDSGPDDAFGYYMGVSSEGTIFLSRQADNYTLLAHSPFRIALNTWYHLKVQIHGSQFTVFFGNKPQPILYAHDSFCTHGQIGVRAHNCNASFRHIRYQDKAD